MYVMYVCYVRMLRMYVVSVCYACMLCMCIMYAYVCMYGGMYVCMLVCMYVDNFLFRAKAISFVPISNLVMWSRDRIPDLYTDIWIWDVCVL